MTQVFFSKSVSIILNRTYSEKVALNLSLHPVPNDHHRRWVGETQDSSIIPDGAAGCLVFWPKSFTLENKTGCIPNNFIMNRVEYQFLNITLFYHHKLLTIFYGSIRTEKLKAKINFEKYKKKGNWSKKLHICYKYKFWNIFFK